MLQFAQILNSELSFIEHKLLYYALCYRCYMKAVSHIASGNLIVVSFDCYMKEIYERVKNDLSDWKINNNYGVGQLLEESIQMIESTDKPKELLSFEDKESREKNSTVFNLNIQFKTNFINPPRQDTKAEDHDDSKTKSIINNKSCDSANSVVKHQRKFQVFKQQNKQSKVSTILKEDLPIRYQSILFTKRENIDKFIVRKFKRYLKTKYRSKKKLHLNKFTKSFISLNLLPPFEHNREIFNSFCTKYMIWLFRDECIQELYRTFVNETIEDLVAYYKERFNPSEEELENLREYVLKMDKIFRAEAEKQITGRRNPRLETLTRT